MLNLNLFFRSKIKYMEPPGSRGIIALPWFPVKENKYLIPEADTLPAC
jgi:hypothetical protein